MTKYQVELDAAELLIIRDALSHEREKLPDVPYDEKVTAIAVPIHLLQGKLGMLLDKAVDDDAKKLMRYSTLRLTTIAIEIIHHNGSTSAQVRDSVEDVLNHAWAGSDEWADCDVVGHEVIEADQCYEVTVGELFRAYESNR